MYDLLNLGVILARFDDISNQQGKIIVATTNHKDKLDPALCRDQRLTPVYFTFYRKQDMIKSTEKFYEIRLTEKQKIYFPDRESKISPAKFKTWIEQYEDLDQFLAFIKTEPWMSGLITQPETKA